MSTDANKALARRQFEENDRGDLDAQMALYAADATIYCPGPMDREAFKQFLSLFQAAFPDGRHIIEDQLAEDDKVTTRWMWRGTHRGDFQGMPATGTEVTLTGMNIDRIVGGRIVERWVQFDSMGLLQQLGALPTPSQATA